MNDETDYQELTDICFENGGVSKPMVDKLSAWHTRKLKEAVREAKLGIVTNAKAILDENGAGALREALTFDISRLAKESV